MKSVLFTDEYFHNSNADAICKSWLWQHSTEISQLFRNRLNILAWSHCVLYSVVQAVLKNILYYTTFPPLFLRWEKWANLRQILLSSFPILPSNRLILQSATLFQQTDRKFVFCTKNLVNVFDCYKVCRFSALYICFLQT